ncbi:MAG: hypothetical protein HQL76_12670 [Magnetococcales bacterium]|nr:hypothetical protein [Magnetococcales bacterium]
MINVSMLEVTLTQSTMSTGTHGNKDGFESIFTRTVNARAIEVNFDEDGDLLEPNQSSGGMDALLAILHQRSGIRCCSDIESRETVEGQDENSGIEGLWALLFELLDKTSRLASELYETVPENAPVSPWPGAETNAITEPSTEEVPGLVSESGAEEQLLAA